MRIAFVLPSMQQSGPGIQINTLIPWLIKLGAEVEIFYFRDTDGVVLDTKGIRCQKIVPLRLKKQLEKFDVVHTNGFFPDIINVIIGLVHKRIIRVTTLHNFITEDFANRYPPLKCWLFSSFWLCILRFIPNKIVFTEIARRYYLQKIPGKLHIVGSGVPVDRILNLLRDSSSYETESIKTIFDFRSKGLKIIGSTSVISKVKGLEVVIKGLVNLTDHAAVFVGGGPDEKSLQNLSVELGVSERVVFLGFQKNPIFFMRFFDIYAMTSSSEAFGLSLFEAIACQVPIVCNRIPVFEELLSDDLVCFYDGSPSDFSAKVLRSNNNKRERRAFDYLLLNYDVSIISKKYYSLYNELISK
ncbi:glycosyltransferase family 4 protein [Dryocola clanedunensis]